MNMRYFFFALAITVGTTIISWIQLFDSTSSSGRGTGSTWSSGRSGWGGGGGHK